jgi:hypothetical protein
MSSERTAFQRAILGVRRAIEQTNEREAAYSRAWRSADVGRAREARDRMLEARADELQAHRTLSLATLTLVGADDGATLESLLRGSLVSVVEGANDVA